MAVKGNGNGASSITTWAALAGHWKFNGQDVVYSGPEPQYNRPFGVALSNHRLKHGEVSARARFTKIEKVREDWPAVGIVLGYQVATGSYLLPQLGGYGAAYALAEFVPGSGWKRLATSGSVENLRIDHDYRLNVEISGQQIRLSVDDVGVLAYQLSAPLTGDQVGLFGFGGYEIRYVFEKPVVRRPSAFVAMPFREPFNTLYKEVIEPRTKLDFEVNRIDEKPGPGLIFKDIQQEIAEADVVIAEISDPNQNVFYEVGYAHALNKPTILLAKRGIQLPFDISSYRVIFYDDSIGGKPEVERNLDRFLRAVLESR